MSVQNKSPRFDLRSIQFDFSDKHCDNDIMYLRLAVSYSQKHGADPVLRQAGPVHEGGRHHQLRVRALAAHHGRRRQLHRQVGQHRATRGQGFVKLCFLPSVVFRLCIVYVWLSSQALSA